MFSAYNDPHFDPFRSLTAKGASCRVDPCKRFACLLLLVALGSDLCGKICFERKLVTNLVTKNGSKVWLLIGPIIFTSEELGSQ